MIMVIKNIKGHEKYLLRINKIVERITFTVKVRKSQTIKIITWRLFIICKKPKRSIMDKIMFSQTVTLWRGTDPVMNCRERRAQKIFMKGF